MPGAVQLDLLAPRFPRARRTDPRSSHEAAALIERTGVAGRQAQAVLAAMRAHPLSTSMELARAAGIDRYAVARRAPELAAQGLAIRIDPTDDTLPCAVSGKRVCRWMAR